MALHILKLAKRKVYDEVAKTSSYTGTKLNPESYERIFITDEDEKMLDRFWDECKSAACSALKRVLQSETEDADGVFELTMDLSSLFDESQLDSMQLSFMSFFVMSITAKWFVFTNKGEVGDYATSAATHLDDIMSKVFYKKSPTRPTYE